MLKNPPANAGDTKNSCSIPELGKSPRGINNNQLQYSCLKNPMDKGAWGATVPWGCKESDVTEQLSMHTVEEHRSWNEGTFK